MSTPSACPGTSISAPTAVRGKRNYWTADYHDDFPDDALETFVSYGFMRRSPFTQQILVPWGGAVSRIDDAATPMAHRDASWITHPFAVWDGAENDAANIAWARSFRTDIAAHANGGVYLNFIGHEGQERIRAAYGDQKYARFAAIKAEYDPQRLPQQSEHCSRADFHAVGSPAGIQRVHIGAGQHPPVVRFASSPQRQLAASRNGPLDAGVAGRGVAGVGGRRRGLRRPAPSQDRKETAATGSADRFGRPALTRSGTQRRPHRARRRRREGHLTASRGAWMGRQTAADATLPLTARPPRHRRLLPLPPALEAGLTARAPGGPRRPRRSCATRMVERIVESRRQGELAMIGSRSIDTPDETRKFQAHGHVDVVTLGDFTLGRGTFEPGWQWSNDVKPIAGTDSCMTRHTGICVSGKMTVRSDDGTEATIGAGDVFLLEPGHDAWTVGEEPCVLYDTGIAAYAKPAS